jgi:hypothetical protein
LIESLLLGLPIPQIVLFQREDGVLELIDGLQRISSLIRFISGRSPNGSDDEDGTDIKLVGCDILTTLNGKTYEDLEPVLKLEMKRKTFRAIVIKRTNDPNLRYEMFKRLNSGGSPAEPHEIRNASLRIVGKSGEQFLDFLHKCSTFEPFLAATDSLSDQAKDRLGREELVLRFFALKNAIRSYKGNISDWLDEYSENVVKGDASFDYKAERVIFKRVFTVLGEKFGEEAFLKHKNKRALGGLAPAYFDAVTMGTLPLIARLERASPAEAKAILSKAVGHENPIFRANVGPGANATPRLFNRIAEVKKVFEAKLPK